MPLAINNFSMSLAKSFSLALPKIIMSNCFDNFSTTSANFSGYQRLALPYDAPGLIPRIFLDLFFFELLV